MYKPGLNVIIKNNTNNYIGDVYFTEPYPTDKELNEGLEIKDIKPHSITKGHGEFEYLESTGMHYKNKLSELVPLAVAYIINPQGINIVAVIIKDIDDNGNIVEYKVLNSIDYDIQLFLNSIVLEIQYFFYNLIN